MKRVTDKNDTTDYKLDHLIGLMERIAVPIPAIPAIPPITPNGDHDLLTKLDTKVDQIQSDVSILKNQGDRYITTEQHAELCKLTTDHENRLRGIETRVTQILTYGTAVVFILNGIVLIVGLYLKSL